MKKRNGKIIFFLLYIAFAFLGAVGGFLHYRFVGCGSGGCSITGNPYFSTVIGAVFGLLVEYSSSRQKPSRPRTKRTGIPTGIPPENNRNTHLSEETA